MWIVYMQHCFVGIKFVWCCVLKKAFHYVTKLSARSSRMSRAMLGLNFVTIFASMKVEMEQAEHNIACDMSFIC